MQKGCYEKRFFHCFTKERAALAKIVVRINIKTTFDIAMLPKIFGVKASIMTCINTNICHPPSLQDTEQLWFVNNVKHSEVGRENFRRNRPGMSQTTVTG